MNADHALLSGEVKRSVSIEVQRQLPSLSLHFLPVVCISICTFSYPGGGGGGGARGQKQISPTGLPSFFNTIYVNLIFLAEQPLRITN